MDTLSHGAWGYLALHRIPRLAWWGVLAGAAPDLLWFVPSKIEQVFEKGWIALSIGREPGIWRADGPPLPPELVEAYFRYYVWTHSLVMLAIDHRRRPHDSMAAAGVARRAVRAAHPHGHPDPRALPDAAALSVGVVERPRRVVGRSPHFLAARGSAGSRAGDRVVGTSPEQSQPRRRSERTCFTSITRRNGVKEGLFLRTITRPVVLPSLRYPLSPSPPMWVQYELCENPIRRTIPHPALRAVRTRRTSRYRPHD